MRIFIVIILFFFLITAGIWYGYQYFSQGAQLSKSDLEKFIGFQLPPDAMKLEYFTLKGFNQTVYIYFQLDNEKFPDFLSSFPCQQTLDDVSYTAFMVDFENKKVGGETNSLDRHQAVECVKGTTTYQLAIYPHDYYRNIYMKIFTL